MKFMFPLDDDCPASLRKAFFDAIDNTTVRTLADEVARASAALFGEHGRLAEIRQAVLLSEATGQSVIEMLRARIDDLRSQREGMQRAVADLQSFATEQRQRVQDDLNRCTSLMINGPSRMDSLRAKVRNYAQSRETMATKLRGAGLSDDDIQRTGVKPTPDDLAAWHSEIADIELGMRRAVAFIASGPLYDVGLLSGASHVA
ncbi:hypothetical protein [Paraburkholderia hospita]|uniref:hypothetical protein n=1 Tax=Paraburkholderia hospita TaxID=169430 RepID=UPI000DEEDADD|nr:hypothetical protein [Paraburkholderia hospita]AXE97738.1 hypothetical protein CUJ88_04030 [Paraburkholderia hospita]